MLLHNEKGSTTHCPLLFVTNVYLLKHYNIFKKQSEIDLAGIICVYKIVLILNISSEKTSTIILALNFNFQISS